MKDDSQDATYNPLKNTPLKRVAKSVSISRTQKEKISLLDGGGSCLVTNVRSPTVTLQYAHIVPSPTKDELVRHRMVLFPIATGVDRGFAVGMDGNCMAGDARHT